MNVLLTGSSGLVGRALAETLVADGHTVIPLRRTSASQSQELDPRSAWWDPTEGTIDLGDVPIDAVCHLAGENIASGRWGKAKKRRIRDSRVEGTRLLARALAQRGTPPRVLVSASAVGFHGDRGAEASNESTPRGSGFLAEVCAEWETATEPARDAGIRVVHLRIGVVLSSKGGVLTRMALPFRMGVGGRVGSGRQYMSWVHIDDLVALFCFALTQEELEGPMIAAAPEAVTNLELTRALGRALRRPTVLPLPAFAVRLLFGEMGEELLLASVRAFPKRALDLGFSFRFPQIDSALGDLL